MKTKLPSHINDWSFNKHKKENFIIRYDFIIILTVFILGYFLIF